MTLAATAATAIAHALSSTLLRPLASIPTLPPAPAPWPTDTVRLRYAG